LLAGAVLVAAGFAAGLTALVLSAGALTGADLGAVTFVAGAVLIAGVTLSTGALSAAACTGLIFDIKIPFHSNKRYKQFISFISFCK
jgi:hypothetical protein